MGWGQKVYPLPRKYFSSKRAKFLEDKLLIHYYIEISYFEFDGGHLKSKISNLESKLTVEGWSYGDSSPISLRI